MKPLVCQTVRGLEYVNPETGEILGFITNPGPNTTNSAYLPP